MTIHFGREVCGRLPIAVEREWLVTNGIGGYASGTVAGVLTRRYHALLMAALQPPVARTLLLAKLDEVARYRGRDYPLHTNAWGSRAVEPQGYRHIESFELEGTRPVWRFAFSDVLIKKQIWMQQGSNTTYIRYTMVRGSAPVVLSLRALANFRDSHGNTQAGGDMYAIESVKRGLKITPPGAISYYVLSDRAEASSRFDWYLDFSLSVETERGLPDRDDHAYVGDFTAALSEGESLTFVVSTDLVETIDGAGALAEQIDHEARCMQQSEREDAPAWIRQLVLAADQFIVKRALPEMADGRTVIAGYHWFTDWGRDTMIALPGLTLTTGRSADAAMILRTFASLVNQGMLPNTFPDAGEAPMYNTVDATLWYFQAIRAYFEHTQDANLIRELYPVLKDIIDWHERGTRHGIQVDPEDGLLRSGEPGVQLTWMDVKIDDWVVTPRTGKAVEINALWYSALLTMREFADLLKQSADATRFQEAAARVQASFARFWNAETGYLYDVLDTPEGNADASMRPNAIFAVSLRDGLLNDEQARSVVDECAVNLVTSFGLRTLAPDHSQYSERYTGDRAARDRSYHQGPVWGWLIGAFVEAHLRVYGDEVAARSFIQAFADHLHDGVLGSIAEIFDSVPPHQPRGAAAQAWSVAEVLRAWVLTQP
ncbi:MAG: glycogen debranching enzyme family protein [Chloroflexi bacterium]|nr:glycogen debranching enzyme family protein [Chloroflexota bacterium]